MAEGDITVFEEFSIDALSEVYKFLSAADTVKCMLITNASAPTAADATPTYSDYSGNECSGTGYTAGGAAVSYTFTEAGGTATFAITSDISWAQNALGPEDAYYGVVYCDSAASKNAFCFIDLDGPLSLRTGDITIGSGTLFTVAVS